MATKKATVWLSKNLSVQGWENSLGYYMLATDVVRMVGKTEYSVADWWRSSNSSSLRLKGWDLDSAMDEQGALQFIFPVKVAMKYWQYLAKQGCEEAFNLICSIAESNLETQTQPELSKV